MLLFGIAVSIWFGSAPKCASCEIEHLSITSADGARIRAHLYVPDHGAGGQRPGVVVCHGYLANSGFVEVPWAEDLVRLGMAVLFIDRRGHGESSGSWRPLSANGEQRLADLHPDIRAAVGYLRSRAPLVDPTRIALLGHSDGGTGAIMAASADWDIEATVSLSASVAPWEYVNHVVPKNLLLLYGAEDRFILEDTDRLLIKGATRGQLGEEGQSGQLGDGSARRLARVAGAGHVNLLYSEDARRIALTWLADTFRLETEVKLSSTRRQWALAGTVLLLLLVLLWNGIPREAAPGESRGIVLSRHAGIALLWVGGLGLAGWIGPRLQGVPVQEGNVVLGLLGAQSLCLGVVGLPRLLMNRRHSSIRHRLSRIGYGAGAGALAQLAIETTLHPVYTTSMQPQRLALFLGFLAVAAPAFAVISSAAAWAGGQRHAVLRFVPAEVLLAGLTAILAPVLFVRMSVLPVYAFAFAVLFSGTYRAGGREAAPSAAFGAVIFARAASAICAFY